MRERRDAGLAGRRVAVVGGAGFSGHHAALGFAREGAAVEVVDSLRDGQLLGTLAAADDAPNREYHLCQLAGRLEALRTVGIALSPLDARDTAALTARFATTRPEIVVHAIRGEDGDAHAAFEHGLRSLDTLLEATRSLESHVLLMSSDLVYGHSDDPVEETREPTPRCLAGTRDAAAEAWLAGVCAHQGRSFTIVRAGPLYGGRAAGRGHVARFAEDALAGEPLQLSGDGRERRDHTHVDDWVAGLLLLLRDPAANAGTWNLSYGHARSERELAQRVAEYFPAALVQRTHESAPTPRRLPLCIEKARRRLGFSPRRPLESGVPDAVREMLSAAAVERGRPARKPTPWSGARPASGPTLR